MYMYVPTHSHIYIERERECEREGERERVCGWVHSMALEALSSSELLNFIMYDCNNAAMASVPTPFVSVDNNGWTSCPPEIGPVPVPVQPPSEAEGGRKKRRRRAKVCKNKEEAESQRMTHIAVERNRRKQMNEHLAVLRSLMPDSYVQRGDQASIVGGAIEFVKELEHILQSLEAKKFALTEHNRINTITVGDDMKNNKPEQLVVGSPFAQFFAYPQFSSSSKYTSQSKVAAPGSIADIEVTLIETHANIRILSRRRVRQLSKMVAAFQAASLAILHLNVTTLDTVVLYSVSAKVEEGCQLNSADEIAGAVHHMLRIIEEEAVLGCES